MAVIIVSALLDLMCTFIGLCGGLWLGFSAAGVAVTGIVFCLACLVPCIRLTVWAFSLGKAAYFAHRGVGND